MTETAHGTNPLSVVELGDALALTQHTFGRVPEDSLVLIGLRDGTTQGHLRVDLAPIASMPEAYAEQVAIWLTADPEKAPEGICVIVCDQQHNHSEETLDRISIALSSAFGEIRVAVEHRLTDEVRGPVALQKALTRHPYLQIDQRPDPAEEAAAWVNQPQQEISYPDKDAVDHLLTPLIPLLLDAEEPDWPAITELEQQIDDALARCSPQVKPLVIGAKTLIVHAQGQGTLAAEILAHAADSDSPVVEFARRMTATIHPFAQVYATSHARFRKENRSK